jgi:AAA domain
MNTLTAPAPPEPAAPHYTLPGVNVLLMGPTGTGKTYSIGSLVDTGLEVFYFAFESGTESLFGYWTDRDKPIPTNLHIITVKTASATWTEMADAVRQVNLLSYESLKKSLDPHRSKYDQFEKFLRTFNDVTDDQGNKYGPIDSWDQSRAIVIDGLTGIGTSVMKAVTGGKADRDQKDWGLAQNIVENCLRQLCDGCKSHFILLAHPERQVDEVLGGVKLMVSTLGKALPPKIPPMFSDVILTVRNGSMWEWDTANSLADLKTRNLPVAAHIPPNFAGIIGKWRSRQGLEA